MKASVLVEDDNYFISSIFYNKSTISNREFIFMLRNDKLFREKFTDIIRSCPYAEYRWECGYISRGNLDSAFIFAMVDSPELNSSVNYRGEFDSYISNKSCDAVAFKNIGSTSNLISPTKEQDCGGRDYGTIARFLRTANSRKIDAVWKKLGDSASHRIGETKLWISTAGGGVRWLHFRLDLYPKYYKCRHLVK